ncbi:MAG: hypothetical protein ACM31I_10785 [Deltaproteobacteria bacterium]
MIRNAFLKRVESALEALDAEVDRIAARAQKTERDARIRYDEEIAVLRMKQEVVRATIRRVRDAGGASWGAMKNGVRLSLDDLRSAIDKAIDRLKKSA